MTLDVDAVYITTQSATGLMRSGYRLLGFRERPWSLLPFDVFARAIVRRLCACFHQKLGAKFRERCISRRLQTGKKSKTSGPAVASA